ncbi:MAG: MBOAT family protein [Muribaculaceae bacterium]|nr:MBOAT family protein [Muribaculaceae bacterium]MCM1398868.1 MBOAT family protein [Clostridium sp.]MCM1458501.1 MBOAT family protein [Bacteroides sp.]
MVFSSLVFLCIFFPVIFCLHSVIPSIKAKNVLLIMASLVFYAFGEPVYVVLMVLSAFLNYLCARFMGKANRKAVLALAVVVNIGILGVFKYSGFLVTTINSVFHLNINVPEITLPIGISFFTFQALSYVIDVYRGQVEVQKNFGKVLLYISFFPQLIAGPIVKYRDIAYEIDNRSTNLKEAALGMRRFICGLAKKVLIANAMAVVADAVFMQAPANVNIVGAWIGAIAYTMQIYYDFSGYSDMAIGLGRMFGFHFKENFEHPYGSLTIKEFWRRWHISLSSWFKEYVYIPLGGNRKGRLRTGINKVIVFFLTGLWHGANWTFVVWGLFHGAFSFLEEFVPKLKKLPNFIFHIYTMLAVTVGFVIFRADTLKQAFTFIGKMFAGFEFSAVSMSFACQQLTPFFIAMLIAAVIGCGMLRNLTMKLRAVSEQEELTKKENIVQVILFTAAFLLLSWCIIRLSGGSYNPFIYFRF